MNKEKMNTEELIAQMAQEGARPALPKPIVMTGLALAVVIVYIMLIFKVFNGVGAEMSHPLSFEAALCLLTIAVSLLAANYETLPDEGQAPHVKYLAIAVMIGLFVYVCYRAFTQHELTFLDCIKERSFKCLVEVIVFSILPMIASIAMCRYISRGIDLNVWAIVLWSLASGFVGYLGLYLIDVNHTNPMSLLVWHFPSVLLVCALTVSATLIYRRWVDYRQQHAS